MKITRFHIARWRNLIDLTLDVPTDSSLISLVGSNGTGKTNLLEFLSFAAAQFGLAAGVRPQQREAPPPDSKFHVVLTISDEVEIALDVVRGHLGAPAEEVLAAWDRTLTLWRVPAVPPAEDRPFGFPPNHAGEAVIAGGVAEGQAHSLGSAIVQAIHQRLELNHLFLDAERSYGPVNLRDEQILAASREDPEEPGRTRQAATVATANMYEEWLRSALGLEHRHAAQFTQAHREANARQEDGPPWEDPWAEYRAAVSAILPHLEFDRPDQDHKTLVFRAGAHSVPYHELSGGEREVAFLTGQLLRFRLRRGLLLLDEPELHLNAELLERWLTWAGNTVADGQVWIATHSLEAVEVAGPSNALVLERDRDGLVRRIARLSDRPIMKTLSGALGAPAFSLDRQRFILIEGERPGAERVRFASICPGEENLFLEAGNCGQVLAKLALITSLAQESDRIHIGGVIDRDHWDIRHRQRFAAQAPVHVLGVHEIENLFLFPEALSVLAVRNGDPPERGEEALREASDRFAGLWVSQRASVRHDVDLGPSLRGRAGTLTWQEIDSDRALVAQELSGLAELGDESIRPQVEQWIGNAVDQYADVRAGAELWAQCSGKQVVGAVAPALGIADAQAFERHVLKLLADEAVAPPTALTDLRQYVRGLSVAVA